MSSQRSRANKSLGNKLNDLDSQIRKTSGAEVVPGTNSVGPDALQPEAVGPEAYQPGSVGSPAIARGAVGTENLGVVSALTSDGDLVLTVPGAVYIQPSVVGPPSLLLPVGMVVPFAGYQYSQTEPYGWLLCDGGAVSRTDYPLLFASLGTRYGAGNGTTTFNLPNLINRYPHGASLQTKDLENDLVGLPGSTGGEVNHTLTVAEMPAHTHTQNSHNHTQASHFHNLIRLIVNATTGASGGTGENSGVSLTQGATGGRFNHTVQANDPNDDGSITDSKSATINSTTATNQNTGGGQDHNNMPPYVAMHYLIKAL